MKKWRKIVVCIWLVVVSLCGCTTIEKNESNVEKLPELKIGYTSCEPFIYQNERGLVTGIDVDISKEVCKRLGYTPVYVEIDWNLRNKCLLEGTIDCLWCGFAMDGIENEYNWTIPYMEARNVIAVKRGSNVVEIKDLMDKRIAVQTGSKAEKGLLGENEFQMDIGSAQYCLTDFPYVVAALRFGYVDAAVGIEACMRAYIGTEVDAYRILTEEINRVNLGVAFKKGNFYHLRDRMNEELVELKEDGTIDKIRKSYAYKIKGGE